MVSEKIAFYAEYKNLPPPGRALVALAEKVVAIIVSRVKEPSAFTLKTPPKVVVVVSNPVIDVKVVYFTSAIILSALNSPTKPSLNPLIFVKAEVAP
jgi:hypothetical protein